MIAAPLSACLQAALRRDARLDVRAGAVRVRQEVYVRLKYPLEDTEWARLVGRMLDVALSPGVDVRRQMKWMTATRNVLRKRHWAVTVRSGERSCGAPS